MLYGACYYPEQWPKERWDTDLKMMKAAGFNVVRMGEFTWARLEREHGVYTFEWLDEIIDLCGDYGIQVILGTPTATPPKWVFDRYPDMRVVDEKGIARGFGSRRHYCYNNDQYILHCKEIVTEMAKRYHDHPNVIAWQIDNEYGMDHTEQCFCVTCHKKFRTWLKNRYENIRNLNEQWGNVVWSQEYQDFDQIPLPMYTHTVQNPSFLLAYRRFFSDSIIRFHNAQEDILRGLCNNQYITHNLVINYKHHIDYSALSKHLDVISWDNYPNITFEKPIPYLPTSFKHSIARGLKQQNFWVMEHQSGAPGGDIAFPAPRKGDIKRWTYQSIAYGASGVIYFRWRTSLIGAEQYWHGILDHDGEENERYQEVKQIGESFKAILPEVETSKIQSEVAIVSSYEIDWVFDIQPMIIGYDYTGHLYQYFKGLRNHQVMVDVIGPEDDFSHYKLLILPNMIMGHETMKSKLEEYVKKGGRIVMDYRAGVKNLENKVNAIALPGAYRQLLGIKVKGYTLLVPDDYLVIETSHEQQFQVTNWLDFVQLETATDLYTVNYDEEVMPIVTKHSYGDGFAYYIAGQLNEAFLSEVLLEIGKEAQITTTYSDTAEGIELVLRQTQDGQLLKFIINHNDHEVDFPIELPMVDLITGEHHEGLVRIARKQTLILKSSPMK
jgi:beta-galactosidase